MPKNGCPCSYVIGISVLKCQKKPYFAAKQHWDMAKQEALSQRAEGFLGRELPLSMTGIQSNEPAVFSEVCKGFGATEGDVGGEKNLSAKLTAAEGRIFFVPLEKVLAFFERD